MAWVVDTCLLIDILEDDPSFGVTSARFLDGHAGDGLLVCPVTYAELAPAFQGNPTLQDEFLDGVGVDYRQDWVWRDTLKAHAAWHEHIRRRRAGLTPKRPLADVLIGSFALRFQGLITRNPEDFRTAFPSLVLRVPGVSDEDEPSPDAEGGRQANTGSDTQTTTDTEDAAAGEEEREPGQGDQAAEPARS